MYQAMDRLALLAMYPPPIRSKTDFTYTNPEPLLFIRAPIKIDYIDGDVAVLDDGPEVGTAVVTVGAAQLYGVEFGIGK